MMALELHNPIGNFVYDNFPIFGLYCSSLLTLLMSRK